MECSAAAGRTDAGTSSVALVHLRLVVNASGALVFASVAPARFVDRAQYGKAWLRGRPDRRYCSRTPTSVGLQLGRSQRRSAPCLGLRGRQQSPQFRCPVGLPKFIRGANSSSQACALFTRDPRRTSRTLRGTVSFRILRDAYLPSLDSVCFAGCRCSPKLNSSSRPRALTSPSLASID